jgi:acetyl esterase/lipase
MRFLLPALLLLTALPARAQTPPAAQAQTPQPLWAEGAPPSPASQDPEEIPTLTPYTTNNPHMSGAAMIICPGGGYGGLAMDHEGEQVAQWLAKNGIQPFVLKYRHAPKSKHPAPLNDAQRAIRTVRAAAATYGIDPHKVGMIGFSAGGHLVASTSTLATEGKADATDPVERESGRPNFACVMYPVITMSGDFGHDGSRKNLIGLDAPQELRELLSPDLQVTAATPPTFIVHTGEDQAVPVENALVYYRALVAAKVPAELHIYEQGRHGLGLGTDAVSGPTPDAVVAAFGTWPDHFLTWLHLRKILD